MTTTLQGLARPVAIAAIGLAGLASLLATGGSPGVTDPGDPENPNNPSGASTWAKSYGGPARDHATSVAPTRDGGLVFAGVYNGQLLNPGILDAETEGDVWVVKLDAFGDVEWQRQYGDQRLGGGEGTLRAFSITRQGPDGTLWAIGAEAEVRPPRASFEPYTELRRDASVLRLSADGQAAGVPLRLDVGDFIELDFFIQGDTADETGLDVWPTADGGALAAIWVSALVRGNATTGVPLRAAWIVRLEANGTVRWSRLVTDDRFDHLDEQPARLLVRELADGGAVAAISARLRREEESGHELRLVRLDAAGGIVWSERHARATVHDLVQMDSDGDGSADGDLVLVGVEHEDPLAANPQEDRGLVLRARLADGAEAWRRTPEGVDGIAALYSVAEYCQVTTGGDRFCTYHAVGDSVFGLNLNRYLRTAVAMSVDADGDTIGAAEYPELSSAWQIRPKPAGTNFGDTFQILGDRDGGGFYLVVDFTLEQIDEIQAFSGFRPGLGRTVFATFGSVSDIIDTTARDEIGCSTSGDGQRARIARFTSTAALLWERPYDACDEQRVERAHVVRQAEDGGYFVAAETSDGGEPLAWLLKLDAQGEIVWQRVLENTYYFADPPAPLEIADTTDDGGFILGAAAGSRLRLIKLDAGGLEQWNSLPLSPARVDTEFPEYQRELAWLTGGERVSSVRQAGDGGYVAAGRIDTRSWIARLDASGSVLWRRSYGPQLDITSIRPLEDGGYVAAGLSGFRIPWAMRLDANGNVLWSERYAFGQAAGGPVVRIEVVPAGGFLLAASHIDASPSASAEEAASTGRHNLLVVRLDEDGAARWHRIFGGLYDEFLYGTAVLADGGFALAARSDSMGDFSEAWVLRLGPDGHVSAGCNALLAAGEGSFEQPVNASAAAYTPVEGQGVDVPAQVMPRETMLPSLVPADHVVARQCLGTAQPEDPVEPDPGSTFTLTVVQGGESMGVVTSTPQGIVCGTEGGGTCSAEFEAGSTVFLDVDLGSLQRFARWEGCDDVDGTLCIVEMGEDREVTAFFEEQGIVPLSFQVTGNGLVQFDEPGRTCSPETEPCVVNYANGVIAIITALPVGDDVLVGWGGDCAVFDRAETFELLMDGPKSCTASFSGSFGPTQVLAVERFANGNPVFSSGVGRVTSTPAGIDCPEACAAEFPRDSAVVLRGEPGPGWEFFRFACPDAGDEDFNQLTATIVMDQDESCIANFRDDIVRVAVTFSEPGVGRVTSDQGGLDCTRDCSWPLFMEFGTVELRVEETNATRFFDHWEGCDNVINDSQGGPHPVCVVSATRAGSVHASFSMVGGGNTLTVQKADTAGRGRVVSSPAGIDCGQACAANFAAGSTVVLTAIPDPGSVFSEWRGDPDCADGTVTMDANRVCEAVFELDTTTFSITISSVTGPGFVQDTSGGGLNCPGVCTASYPANSQVIIFADTTQPGADFIGWGGDCASFGNQSGMVLTMDRNYVCSAAFE